MSRDYAHEEWIPWYTRDTAGWLELSLAARGAAEGIARKMGRHSHELHVGSRGLKGLARILGCDWHELEPALVELLAPGPNGEPARLVYDEDRRVLVDTQAADRRRRAPTSTERVRNFRKRQAEAGPRESVVYFLRRGDGAIKIGTTTNLIERIYNLSFEQDERLELVGYMAGSLPEERGLHLRFAKTRLDGEWFEATRDLVALATSVGDPAVLERFRNAQERSGTLRNAVTCVSYSHSGSDLDLSDPEDLEEIPSARARPPTLTPPASAEDDAGTPIAPPDTPEPHPVPESAPAADVGAASRPPEPPRPRGVARPLHVRRFEQPYYQQAFADGASSVTGCPYIVAREELSALDDAIDTHAPEGPASNCEAWVRESVAAYRVAIRGREQFHRGGGPRGWRDWLNEGRPSAEWLAMTPAEREAHAADEKRREAAKARKAREAARKAAETAENQAEAYSAEAARAAAAGFFATVARVGPPLPAEPDVKTGT